MMIRGKTIEVRCQHCSTPFMARVVDRKRGWGKFCSKSCKAIKQNQRTGQYTNYMNRKDGEPESFANAHLFDNSYK